MMMGPNRLRRRKGLDMEMMDLQVTTNGLKEQLKSNLTKNLKLLN